MVISGADSPGLSAKSATVSVRWRPLLQRLEFFRSWGARLGILELDLLPWTALFPRYFKRLQLFQFTYDVTSRLYFPAREVYKEKLASWINKLRWVISILGIMIATLSWIWLEGAISFALWSPGLLFELTYIGQDSGYFQHRRQLLSRLVLGSLLARKGKHRHACVICISVSVKGIEVREEYEIDICLEINGSMKMSPFRSSGNFQEHLSIQKRKPCKTNAWMPSS